MEKRGPRVRRGGVVGGRMLACARGNRSRSDGLPRTGGFTLRMTNVFFHIGMHKTATSWFQRQLFPNIDGAYLISSKKMDEIAAALAAFDAQTSRESTVLVVSHEGLGGSISWDRRPGETLERLSRNLAALMTLRPDAAVIIGYRKHEGWLRLRIRAAGKAELGHHLGGLFGAILHRGTRLVSPSRAYRVSMPIDVSLPL